MREIIKFLFLRETREIKKLLFLRETGGEIKKKASIFRTQEK